MLAHRFEHIGARGGAFGGEIVAGMRADFDDLAPRSGAAKRRAQPRQRGFFQPLVPFAFGEIEPVGRQRLIERAAAAGMIERFLARLIVVLDLRQPFVGGLLGQRLDGDRAAVDIIEQRFHLFVEQRQPMLHAGIASAFADGLVEHVVGPRRAEGRDIAGAERADGVAGQLELRHRDQIERAQVGVGALRLRIEAADRFQRVAEEIEPHRLVHAGREQIDDAAAHGIIAGFAHRGGAIKAVEIEPGGDAGHRQNVAGRRRERLLGERIARRHPLQRGIDGGQQHGRMLAARDAGEARQRHHAGRHHGGVRRYPVIRQAIPGRKFQHLDVGGKEGERARGRRHARAVAADDRKRNRRRLGGGRDSAGKIGQHQAFGAVGDAGKRQYSPGR